MTPKRKKTLIILSGVLVGLTTVGLLIYRQVKKMLNFDIGVKGLKFHALTLNKLAMSIAMKFTNKSDLTVVLSRQEYDVYLNDIFITTLKSDKEQVVHPMATSILDINVDINPTELFEKIPNKLEVITNIKQQRLKLVTKLWVKFGAINIPIKYPYEAKIKDWA